jgi:hypothetical protein
LGLTFIKSNWVNLLYNPFVHAQAGAFIYGMAGGEDSPFPSGQIGSRVKKSAQALYEGLEYLDDGLRMIDQPLGQNLKHILGEADRVSYHPKNATKGGIEVTEASIAKALEGSTMQTLQGKVSLPMIQRYVKMLESGSVAPPIKVADGVIVEGNHRYVAGRLFGVEPVQAPYIISPSQMNRAVPVQKTVVDFLDWGGH